MPSGTKNDNTINFLGIQFAVFFRTVLNVQEVALYFFFHFTLKVI